MVIPYFCQSNLTFPLMNRVTLLIVACLALPLAAEIRPARKSLLEADPDVIYLDQTLKKPIDLKVAKDAPVFSDKEGKSRLGTLVAGQSVRLEAMTDKVYRVRGQGTREGIVGWVSPGAFAITDPDFVSRLKQLYQRQLQVRKLIDAKTIAVGMTLDEVSQVLGKPTKTTVRKTDKGETGLWEFVEYIEIKHYVTRMDPVTHETYRQLASITREEKSRTNVEFEDSTVTAIEHSEDKKGGNPTIIVPPMILGW